METKYLSLIFHTLEMNDSDKTFEVFYNKFHETFIATNETEIRVYKLMKPINELTEDECFRIREYCELPKKEPIEIEDVFMQFEFVELLSMARF